MKDNIRIAMRKEPNLSLSTFYWRMKNYGTPYKHHDGREKHFIGGKLAVEVAQENGISATLFRARMKKGWTSYRAATQPAQIRTKKQ